MDEKYSDASSDSCDEHFVEDAKVGMVQELAPNKGVVKECLVEGEGTHRPTKGSKVSVHYVGTLASNGEKFDSSRDRGEPFVFDLGKGSVIRGWDVGVATMKKGEKSILTCAPDYAYGSAGAGGSIPPNSTLKFEVELLSWIDTTDISKNKDGSVMKKTLKDGNGWDTPSYESACTFTISTNGSEPKEVQATIGEATDLLPEVELALETMKKGEVCKIMLAGSEVEHELVLKNFEGAKQVYGVPYDERLTEAGKRKDQGNDFYKAKRVALAIRKYEKAIEFLDDETSTDDAQKQVLKSTKVPLYTNLAAAQLFENNFKKCIETCGKALDIEPENTKALLRRAKAYNGVDSWTECRRDLDKLLDIDPKNADGAKELEKLKKKMKAQDAKDKQRFGNMFAKLAKMEATEAEKNPTAEETKEEKAVEEA
eukprot:TRINITY_DN4328_c0_g1_i1.p1 TRINITY_DN4328_c0_g1~~TRINITY_DN4328_c0_g1_i1.p1  ORF type:complete len:437 (+),score=204.14 TRINITY_DN4328_c0_g1_i1:34-1311(+)